MTSTTTPAPHVADSHDLIRVQGARVNNLKDISVLIVVKVATSGGVLSPRDNPAHAHFRPTELDVLVEEATAAGMFVMAHAQAADGIKNAVRAGIRSIEHGIFLDDEGIDLMMANGTWLVPTLVAPRGVLEAAAAGAAIPDRSSRRRDRSSTVTPKPFAMLSRPASASRWAPTPASRRTVTTCANWT